MRLELTDLDERSLLAEAEALMASVPCAAQFDSSRRDASADSCDSDKNPRSHVQEGSRRRMYRERRKNERNYLESQEIKLFQELVQIRQAMAEEKAKIDAGRSPSYLMWKSIAMQQLEQRLSAEEEQRQLLALVGAQASYIQRINAPEVPPASNHSDAMHHTKRQRVEDIEVALCSAYIQQLESNYERIGELMDECGIADLLETVVYSVHRRPSDGEVEFFQRLHQYVEPHSLHQTAELLWTLGGNKFRGRGQHEQYVAVPDPENTVAMKFRETFMLETGAMASLLHRHVARRWFGDGRLCIAWILVTEGEGVLNGLCLEETGWIRLRPSTATNEPGTQIEMCVRQVPMLFKDPMQRDQSVAKQFHDLTQRLSDGTATEVIHALGNFLPMETCS
ncbi:hypothetical protein PHYBOEH_005948 [Phytophthora boehmeriae]|uniref:Uncharacterized protein n=1 Tax=Phytophthora boehmeriae TaxID=109152 RepID=A0A8T1WPW8_9STRA|nr:hypothetical protein PHYBOEH_005948 [Phytophthora boehmeriae]